MLIPHSGYLALGYDNLERAYTYRELFRNSREPEQVHDIRTTMQIGTLLGNDLIGEEVEKILKCKVGQDR